MKRRKFLQNAGILSASPLVSSVIPANTFAAAHAPFTGARKLWLNYLDKLAYPVLSALSADQLKAKMPVEAQNPAHVSERRKYTHLEAFGRLLAGIAPWLQADGLNGTEKQLQDKYYQLALKSTANAVNPAAKDHMNWGDEGGQPLVDASFFAYALIRCPKLWQGLDSATKKTLFYACEKPM